MYCFIIQLARSNEGAGDRVPGVGEYEEGTACLEFYKLTQTLKLIFSDVFIFCGAL